VEVADIIRGVQEGRKPLFLFLPPLLTKERGIQGVRLINNFYS